LLFFAELLQVYDRAIAYHIQKGDYTAALSVLEQAPFDKVEELFYHFSVILMEQAPKSTVRIWMTKSRLQPTKLLPALIRYGQSRRLGMERM